MDRIEHKEQAKTKAVKQYLKLFKELPENKEKKN